jgi:hypothetical protein
MLTFLLSFQVQSSQTPQILLANCFVNCGASSDTLAIVVCCVCPPIGFRLNIADYHILDGSGQSWDLPRDIRFKATPSLRKVLENRFCLVGFNSFRHHIVNVHYHRGTQLKIILTLYSLLRDSFCDPFAMTALKLPCK